MKKIPRVALLSVAAAFVVVAVGMFWMGRGDELPDEVENLLELRNLPANTWVKYAEGGTDGWWRQGHAGLAYDDARGSLIVFGSDTHNENWDNSVHEFHPLKRRWVTHYAEAPKSSYRPDGEGHAVAGESVRLPWAMHTYDNVTHDAARNVIIVTSRPEHNPVIKAVAGVREHPLWAYNVDERRWQMMRNHGRPAPRFFGGASAYDEARDVIVVYHRGIWEMGPERDEWRRASKESHHALHQSLVYDSWRRKLFVFGNYRPTNVVWSYTPGESAGTAGDWERRIPQGDDCPPYGSVPVAFDRSQGVFLLAVNDRRGDTSKKPKKALTFVFDPDANRYHRLPQAELPALGMNYMMAWDRRLQVFFLVTGDWNTPVTVWALRLNSELLRG